MENYVELVTSDFVKNIVEPVREEWIQYAAHSLHKYGRSEQSMFWHSLNAVGVGLIIIKTMNGNEDLMRKFCVCAFFHDIDKLPFLNIDSHDKVTADHIKSISERYKINISGFSKMSDENIALSIRNHHWLSNKSDVEGLRGEKELRAITNLVAISDSISAIETPSKIIQQNDDRNILKMFESLGFPFTLAYHEYGLITGIAANLTNQVIADLLMETRKAEPVAFFPEGCIYLMPHDEAKKGFEDFHPNIIAERVINRFFKTLEKRSNNILGDGKGQLKPTKIAYIMKFENVINALHEHLIGNVYQKNIQNREKIIALLKKYESELGNIEYESDLKKTEFKKLLNEKKEISEEKLQELGQNFKFDIKWTNKYNSYLVFYLNSQKTLSDLNVDNLIKPNDFLELHVLIEYYSFIFKYLDSHFPKNPEKEKVTYLNKIISNDNKITSEQLKTAKGKKGGVSNSAILAAHLTLNYFNDDNIKIKSSDDASSIIDNMEKHGSLEDRFKTYFSDLVKQLQIVNITFQNQITALHKENIISKQKKDEILKNSKEKNSLTDIFIEELSQKISQNLIISSPSYSTYIPTPNLFNRKNSCCMCGSSTDGIELTEDICHLSQVSSYTIYGAPGEDFSRQSCVNCFIESVLRKIQYPYKNRAFYVYVTPEYITTPYNNMWESIVKSVFPDNFNKNDENPELITLDSAIISSLGLKIEPGSLLDEISKPVLVVALENKSNLENWIKLLEHLLETRKKIGMKYVISESFAPVRIGAQQVKGSIVFDSIHYQLARQIEKWLRAQRDLSNIVPYDTLTIKESNIIGDLLFDLRNLIGYKEEQKVINNLKSNYVSNTGIFPSADIYVKRR